MRIDLKIGGLNVGPGEKKSGRLRVGGKAASEYSLPLTVLNGIGDGPILSIISGQHGTQYTGIATSIEIIRSVDPKKLHGAIVVVPVVNVLGFEQRSRLTFPLEDDFSGTRDINRIWPGSLNLSLAHIVVRSLFDQVVMKSQYLLDLRGGDGYEYLAPSTVMITMVGNNRVDEETRALARIVGYEFIFEATLTISSDLGSRFHEQGTKIPSSSVVNYGEDRGRSQTEAPLAGIPTIVLEAGDQGIIKEEILESNVDAVLNILKFLNMIEGKVTPRKDCKRISGAAQVRCKTGGIYLQKIRTGSMVREGDRVGEVLSMEGSVEEVLANKSGLLLETFCNPSVNTGDILAEIVSVEEYP